MDELAKLMAEAASKLGLEAARIWPQVVMITWAKSVFWLTVDAIVLFLVVPGLPLWTIYGLRKRRQVIEEDAKKNGWDACNDRKEGWEIAIGVPAIVLALLFLLVLIVITDHLAGVVAPEAKTVMDLINAGKG